MNRLLYSLTLLLILSTPLAMAGDADFVLRQVYGTAKNGCTVAADIDEGGSADLNVIGPLTTGKLYVVFCYDSATFAGVACRIKQGASTVDASAGEGSTGEAELVFAGEKIAVVVEKNAEYISFEPLADGTTQVGVACRRN